jgi:uncharacterized membrane protein (DUF485 family)
MQAPNSQYNKEYHEVTTKMFRTSLVNIPLFAVPAFAALFLGKYLDGRFETGKTITVVLIFIAFSLSWVLVLKRTRKMNKEYREVREKMKAEQVLNNKS